MTLDENWITEICEEGGSAFSLKGAKKVFDEQSAFQRVEVYATQAYGKLMMIDGFTMLSSRDNFLYHEMMAHPVLFTHPAPRRIAIIGGGDCGTLREVLNHPEVEQVAHRSSVALALRCAGLRLEPDRWLVQQLGHDRLGE